ncbi:uncharacterized protein [Parasteatoda tepidariorum]|uniref:uncharacterized protein n=1 Tax=Parasteatoda tepidariorum TaxID=114398 RepID=UPI001C719CB3|nr:uncharacterized protein LOC107449653 [Parasteatoda tepidariorum]
MWKTSLAIATFCFLTTLASCHYREKRSGISDQRLAEIETLLALARQGNRDVAYGVIDPLSLGKRKRSYDMDSSNQLEDDFPLDVLREARPKYPSNKYESLMFSHRLPERLFRFRTNEFENRDLQSNDDAAK